MTEGNASAQQTGPSGRDPIRVALLGAGTVGSQVARLLVERSGELAQDLGRRLELAGVACRHPGAVEAPWIDRSLLTTDLSGLCHRADIVVELMGGMEPARTMLLTAMESGASVVTANKALLAASGPELYRKAATCGVDIRFEAAVGGAMPVVRVLSESLAGDRILSLSGIINGTTNFILDQMATQGLDFDEALDQAREEGYAEADPTADIEGRDAASKAAIMATLAFHTRVTSDDVAVQGIRRITAGDMLWAAAQGRVVKLLATVSQGEKGVAARVRPVLLPRDHPFASVHGGFNAVAIQAEAAGEIVLYGQGAGGTPTASAVMGDIVTEARNIIASGRGTSIHLGKTVPICHPDPDGGFFCVRFLTDDCQGFRVRMDERLEEAGITLHKADYLMCPGGISQVHTLIGPCRESYLATVAADLGRCDRSAGRPLILEMVDER